MSQESARKAKNFAVWSAGVSLVIVAIYVVVIVLVAASNN